MVPSPDRPACACEPPCTALLDPAAPLPAGLDHLCADVGQASVVAAAPCLGMPAPLVAWPVPVVGPARRFLQVTRLAAVFPLDATGGWCLLPAVRRPQRALPPPAAALDPHMAALWSREAVHLDPARRGGAGWMYAEPRVLLYGTPASAARQQARWRVLHRWVRAHLLGQPVTGRPPLTWDEFRALVAAFYRRVDQNGWGPQLRRASRAWLARELGYTPESLTHRLARFRGEGHPTATLDHLRRRTLT